MTPDSAPPQSRPRGWGRLVPVVGLLLLSPVCAEYLIGYDASIGSPLAMLAGLLVLAPLYGAVAVLIREATRRTGRGWPTVLLLSTAFGLVQAGLIDQSLFALEFDSGDPDWANEQPPTVIPGLEIDARHLLNWVGGHVIWSFAAPIAVVETCTPRRADRPWLGPVGLAVMALLYLGAAALIASDVYATDRAAAPVELLATAAVVLTLVAAAFLIPRPRTTTAPRARAESTETAQTEAAPAETAQAGRGKAPGRAPSPWAFGVAAWLILLAEQSLPTTWTWSAVAADVALLALLGALVLWGSRRPGWSRAHTLAVAGGALLVRAGLSFLVEPLGEPDYTLKYVSNTAITLGVTLLLAWAAHRLPRTTPPPPHAETTARNRV
ncbi:hypothetical protein LG943_06580 [Streptomonospora sp. S1-112]|uniref:Uncharacterized protein n=1 Tax=Streptomonospora mangrovi TaxID=2883123 RepID=A0A9X3NHX5_9ACTN|nr:hypothetical protein [Streptomonospora mangrovi]MDA0563992.1 hypothetical protein [Streptomonospora mangrovi]